ncbi:bifunctional enoyl-CoA hydratase/phosphate acetyltransferase [Tepidibacter hydrothermalis]|uniref:Bifunctional enoyl-CoA hydratase/phosphate acetyltransferase n=1 Tax=Tepidibacter hydrothermalis TaxID=3036126 RepID=A0ABY8ECG2_9FIRM|nr:bifunctional enoyl-CoA hydratase/phosphate acetyltransferase [Tepidibacter hydrothermalis]WFD09479.1 bifunctional enoyl-CoA hydratase/phosphate acetyltransferase [Tepidibacter hydrothermalis]
MIKKLNEVISKVKSVQTMKLAVAAAQDEEVLKAVFDARKEGIIEPILVGDTEKIKQIAKELNEDITGIELIEAKELKESAEIAVKLVSSKKADFVMKGLIDTSILLKEVLNKEYGLRTESLLSHVMVYEVPSYHKLLILTDGGMNISPNVDQKYKIMNNAIKVAKSLELEIVKGACIAAKEKVSDKMIATVDAHELSKKEYAEGVIVEGPLAFDLSVSKEAARIKNFKSEVAGDVDIMLFPTIEVGNGIGKALTYMGGAKSAGIIMGAKAPVVLVSRADTHESKLYSIAIGALIANNK